MHSIDTLFASIEAARRRIGISKHPAWYRGHSHDHYRLLPTLMRLRNGPKHERNLFSLFLNRGGDLLSSTQSSWKTLAVMQHNGMPTRLLDWTESIDVALFFAIMNKRLGPCIWVLNPYRLNHLTTGKNVIFDESDPLDYDYYTTIRDAGVPPHTLPLAAKLPWSTHGRIKSQKGCFTIHGADAQPIELQNQKFAHKVIIPEPVVKDVLAHFKRKQFDDFDIFPDLAGLSMSLRRQFGLI